MHEANECGKNWQNNDCENLISLCFYARRFFGVYLVFSNSTYMCLCIYMYTHICISLQAIRKQKQKNVLRIRHVAHFLIHVFFVFR